MKFTKLVSIIFLSVALFSVCPNRHFDVYDLDQNFSAKQVQKDFKYFRSTLENNHRLLHEFSSKQKFDALLDSIFASINHHFAFKDSCLLFARIISRFRCGHTAVEIYFLEKSGVFHLTTNLFILLNQLQ